MRLHIRRFVELCVLCAATSFLPAASQAQEAKPATPSALIPYERYRLPNGLEVILHQDRSLPLVSVNIWYHVGPANEPPGRSGFAHLFEHLMFEGSKHVGSEFDRLLEAAGATNVNGTTSWDRTNYFETVPREHLELVLWIESDRMGFMLDALSKERLEVQRGVVKNERRQSYENAPYGPSTLALLDTLFPKGHPYHGAVIGSMEDLSAATLNDVRDFYRRFYAPGNATLTLAGDFEVGRTKALVERYFGSLADRPKPPSRRSGPFPAPAARRLTVEEPVDLAKVTMAWLTPPAYSADDPVIDVLMAVLAGGKATRLYQTLVVQQGVASDVEAALDSNEITSTAVVSAMAASGKTPAELERAMDGVLATLGQQGPTLAELERAKRRIRVSVLSSMQLLNGPGGESGRAGFLQRFNHYLANPGAVDDWIRNLERVSVEDVKRVLAAHFRNEKRVVAITLPGKPSGAK